MKEKLLRQEKHSLHPSSFILHPLFRDDGGYVLFTGQAVEGRQVCAHALFELAQLRVDEPDLLFIDDVGLICRRGIGAIDHTGQRGQLIIQPDRIVERVLTALVLRLVQLLFNGLELRVERPRRFRNGPTALLTFHTLDQIIQLPSHFAYARDAVVRLRQLIPDLDEQVQLPGEVRRGRCDARVFLHFKTLGHGLAVDGEPYLIRAGDDDGAAQFASPENNAGKFGSVLMAQVPDEAVQPCFSRDTLLFVRAGCDDLFTRRRLRLFGWDLRRRTCAGRRSALRSRSRRGLRLWLRRFARELLD